MRRVLLVMLVLLVMWPALSGAEMVICFHPTRPLGEQFSFKLSEDPSRVTDPQCSVIPAEGIATEEQRTLLQAVPRKYLKISNARAVEMDAAEKAAVDAAIVAREAGVQALKDELAQQGVCKFASLQEVTTELNARKATKEAALATVRNTHQAQIDGINATTATTVRDQVKAVLTQGNNSRHTLASELLDEAYILAKNIIRCEFARRGGRS